MIDLLVEDSLRRWCRESWAFAQNQFSKAAVTTAKWTAETAVDTAAFQHLIAGRRLPIEYPEESDELASEVVNTLVSSCPINATSAPEILGSVHEILVGLRGSRRGETATKRASRKVNGIFYTPSFVVNEIVQQTIGPRLANTIQGEGDRICILDPAAGCGAFLVAAFRFLIQHSLDESNSNRDQTRSTDFVQIDSGWKLTYRRCQSLLTDHLFGVDLDPNAIEVTRRVLWLTLIDSVARETIPARIDFFAKDLSTNFKSGQALIGASFADPETQEHDPSMDLSLTARFDWACEFPQIASRGGFDVVIGNPPYRRERDFKQELDKIKSTALGQKHRSARMDLWYYFLHRGIQLLRDGGSLSFITNAYWMQGRGSEKVIATLRDDVHLDEIFLLGDYPIFPGVAGQHVLFRMTKSRRDDPTTIKTIPRGNRSLTGLNLSDEPNVQMFVKTRQQLFRDGRLDVMPSADDLFQKLKSHPRLIEFGLIRQGIAENPPAINRRTMERFPEDALSQQWNLGEGVFSLQSSEVDRLSLTQGEAKLLRPYHDLCDLDRYWAASQPSRQLIYSTRQTCPQITAYPQISRHLSRFRAILEARRETREGHNSWWHLHWPRDDRIWQADKLIALQLAARPSFVPVFGPAYVPFSTNVFVPSKEVREDLRYFCGLLNSRVLWAWFAHSAKRRGVGLELNGHTLQNAPIRRIDFNNPTEASWHDDLVRGVSRRVELARLQKVRASGDSCDITIAREILEIESRLDSLVTSLYELGPAEVMMVDEIVCRERC